MRTLLTSESNIMGAAAASMSYSPEKSNQELVRSLQMNIDEAQRDAQEAETNGTARQTHDWKRWTSLQDSGATLYIPTVDFASSSLSEDSDSYDITVKLFHLHPGTPEEREQHTRHALSLVLQELHVPSVDLLIVSYPSVYFDEAIPDCGMKNPANKPDPVPSLLQSWKSGPQAVAASGLVRRIGVSEFGVERLSAFLEAGGPAPAVDQINLRDHCSVPQDLLALSKKHNVELLVHNDCTNILPSGTVRELLGPSGAGVLAGEANPSGLKGDVAPRWVVKYTAVVRDRGVVENKGYFALAELRS